MVVAVLCGGNKNGAVLGDCAGGAGLGVEGSQESLLLEAPLNLSSVPGATVGCAGEAGGGQAGSWMNPGVGCHWLPLSGGQ